MLVFAIILEVIVTCLILYSIWLQDKEEIKRSFRKAKRFFKAVKVGVCKKVLEREGVVITKEVDTNGRK